jgi:small subunit ribosomal protein S4e
MRRCVTIDGKVRTDMNYPAGFMDVIGIDKTSEVFRLLFDVKGRFVLHKIPAEEAKFKLCKIIRMNGTKKKASIGRNPYVTGMMGAINSLLTHDGRTIRYVDPAYKAGDTVKVDIATGKIASHLSMEVGRMAMITKGANQGRIGVITIREKHPSSFDIVHLRDKRGNEFATRIGNVFVIGEGDNSWVTVPRAKGIKLTIQEEREKTLKRKA